MLFCCSTFPVNSYLSKVCKKFVETVRGRLADANWSLLIRRCVPEMQMQCLQKANPVMKRTSGKKIARKTKETKKWCKTELETLEVVGYNSPKFNSSVNKQCWLKNHIRKTFENLPNNTSEISYPCYEYSTKDKWKLLS